MGQRKDLIVRLFNVQTRERTSSQSRTCSLTQHTVILHKSRQWIRVISSLLLAALDHGLDGLGDRVLALRHEVCVVLLEHAQHGSASLGGEAGDVAASLDQRSGAHLVDGGDLLEQGTSGSNTLAVGGITGEEIGK